MEYLKDTSRLWWKDSLKKKKQAGENESEFLIRLWVVPSECGGIIRDVSLVALAETDVLLQTRRVQLSCADKSCQVWQSKVDW